MKKLRLREVESLVQDHISGIQIQVPPSGSEIHTHSSALEIPPSPIISQTCRKRSPWPPIVCIPPSQWPGLSSAQTRTSAGDLRQPGSSPGPGREDYLLSNPGWNWNEAREVPRIQTSRSRPLASAALRAKPPGVLCRGTSLASPQPQTGHPYLKKSHALRSRSAVKGYPSV